MKEIDLKQSGKVNATNIAQLDELSQVLSKNRVVAEVVAIQNIDNHPSADRELSGVISSHRAT